MRDSEGWIHREEKEREIYREREGEMEIEEKI